MPPFNSKQFTRRITMKAPPKAIYDAWSTQQGLETWFLRLAEFQKADGTVRPKNQPIQAGDHYKWRWFGHDDSAEEQNKILSANGWDEIKFKFSGDCIVTVVIRQEENETICQLVQDMPMDDIIEQQSFFIECGIGWTFYMANLKSVLEGGIDLRNKNPKIRQVINA